MSAASPNQAHALATGRWQLWIDRGGGYDVLQGERFTIGGPGGDNPADIAVRCRWSRCAATLIRSAEGDVLCVGRDAASPAAQPLAAEQELNIVTEPGEPAPRLHYQRPCPLSGSAVVRVLPPHRLFGPADATILLDETILLGPEPFNHARVPALSAQGWVLLRRDGQWWIRGTSIAAQRIELGRRWQHEDWSLMIREA